MSRLGRGVVEVRVTRWVGEVCSRCGGSGERAYGSTATWRGGIGGAAMTGDVCDACWGSGDALRPWRDLRKLDEETRQQVLAQAQRRLEQAMGAGIGLLQGAQAEIAEALERLSNKRKLECRETINLAKCLARNLREMAAAGRDWRPT